MQVENSTYMASSRPVFTVRHVIRDARKARRLTQDDLAERAGVTGETISRIERGVVEPSAETLRALAPVLGMAAADLLAYLDGGDLPNVSRQPEDASSTVAKPTQQGGALAHDGRDGSDHALKDLLYRLYLRLGDQADAWVDKGFEMAKEVASAEPTRPKFKASGES